MCGIVGAIARSSGSDLNTTNRHERAIMALRHRGPDAQGEYVDNRVWLGAVRLSILDLSNAGNQPMSSAGGRFIICYNGEVYNFKDLASELSLGSFRSQSDTELVLRAFEAL